MVRCNGVVAVLALGAAGVFTACGLTNKTLTVQPSLMNMAQVSGLADPNHSCAPPSTPAPDPAAWFAGQSATNKQLLAVGFQVWRNLANNQACQEHKDIAYRGFFQYDLSTVAPLKTVTKATISFASKIIPASATTNASNLCDSKTGGLGSLWEVTPTIPFTSGMNVLTPAPPSGNGILSPLPFPPGTKLVAFTLPWIAGAVGTHTTTLATGQGGASFDVDVTGPVQQALTSNQATIQFMFSASDEAFPRPIVPPASIDCLTQFEVQAMTVTYVSS
jgi:hypothetical protein